MNHPLLRFLVWMITFIVLVSCAKARYGIKNSSDSEARTVFILPEEVTVGDWLTYIVATSLPEGNGAVRLGDHQELIQAKLPVMGLGGWNDYTFRAFLRPSPKYASIEFYSECNKNLLHLVVSETAADSIKELKLMELPITGITYDQALAYVAYIQDAMNTCEAYTQNKYRYACFLPTPEQFDSLQAKLDSVNSKGCNLFNYKNSLCSSCPNAELMLSHPIASRTGMEPTYTQAYFADPNGVMNFKGNVAEMTSVKGVAKGGSCMHYAVEAYEGRSQTYTEPAMWLGFRVWYKRFIVSDQEQ